MCLPQFKRSLPFPAPPGTHPVHDWLRQVTHFPRAANDDEVDAMTQALPRLAPQEKPSSHAYYWAQAKLNNRPW